MHEQQLARLKWALVWGRVCGNWNYLSQPAELLRQADRLDHNESTARLQCSYQAIQGVVEIVEYMVEEGLTPNHVILLFWWRRHFQGPYPKFGPIGNTIHRRSDSCNLYGPRRDVDSGDARSQQSEKACVLAFAAPDLEYRQTGWITQ